MTSSLPIYGVQGGKTTAQGSVTVPKAWEQARILMPKLPYRKRAILPEKIGILIDALSRNMIGLYQHAPSRERFEDPQKLTFRDHSGYAYLEAKATGAFYLSYAPQGVDLFCGELASLAEAACIDLEIVPYPTLLDTLTEGQSIIWLSWQKVRGSSKALALSIAQSKIETSIEPVLAPGIYVGQEADDFIQVSATPPNAFVVFDQPGIREVTPELKPEPGRIYLNAPVPSQGQLNTAQVFGPEHQLRTFPHLSTSHTLDATTCFLVFHEPAVRKLLKRKNDNFLPKACNKHVWAPQMVANRDGDRIFKQEEVPLSSYPHELRTRFDELKGLMGNGSIDVPERGFLALLLRDGSIKIGGVIPNDSTEGISEEKIDAALEDLLKNTNIDHISRLQFYHGHPEGRIMRTISRQDVDEAIRLHKKLKAKGAAVPVDMHALPYEMITGKIINEQPPPLGSRIQPPPEIIEFTPRLLRVVLASPL